MGSVADATANRKAENAEFKATMGADKAAKELIGLAKNRMAKFYNPDLYVAPKAIELSREQRIAVNMGSEAAPTVAPSGIAGTGITYFAQVSAHSTRDLVAPPPPPETWGAYQKNAQAEYETFMSDSQAKRAGDSASIADKEGAKAGLESRLQKMGAEHKATVGEAFAMATTIKDLHLECDWLLSNYGARKEARAGEVDSLKNAKSVLSGSDYALVQQGRTKQLRGSMEV